MLLQKFDREFDEFIDVNGLEEISGGDEIKVCSAQRFVAPEPTDNGTTTKVQINRFYFKAFSTVSNGVCNFDFYTVFKLLFK